jgi:DNA-directed RNA polymerase specialized sigma24 family protein
MRHVQRHRQSKVEMKTKLPEYETTPMTDLIRERIQGKLERQVMYDYLIGKMYYADIAAKNHISESTVGRIIRRGRARIFR